jgi:hypothetical protein
MSTQHSRDELHPHNKAALREETSNEMAKMNSWFVRLELIFLDYTKIRTVIKSKPKRRDNSNSSSISKTHPCPGHKNFS